MYKSKTVIYEFFYIDNIDKGKIFQSSYRYGIKRWGKPVAIKSVLISRQLWMVREAPTVKPNGYKFIKDFLFKSWLYFTTILDRDWMTVEI